MEHPETTLAVDVPKPVLFEAVMSAEQCLRSLEASSPEFEAGPDENWLRRRLLVDYLDARCNVTFRYDGEVLHEADDETIDAIFAGEV